MQARLWLLIMSIISFWATGIIYLILLSKVKKFKESLPSVINGYELYTAPIRKIKKIVIYFSIGIALSAITITTVMMI